MYRSGDVLAHFKGICVFFETAIEYASHQKEETICCPYKVCKNIVMFKDHEVIRQHLLQSGFMDNYCNTPATLSLVVVTPDSSLGS
jgi:hypothetical protein